MRRSTIGRRAVPVIGACLLAGAGALVPQAAAAPMPPPANPVSASDTAPANAPSFVAATAPKETGPKQAHPTPRERNGPKDPHPTPKYREGPKGSNVPPPEKEPSPKMYTSCAQIESGPAGPPVYRGTPEYNPMLDKNNNGIDCDRND